MMLLRNLLMVTDTRFRWQTKLHRINERIECQQNYVIVISDGRMRNHDYAKQQIQLLRSQRGVRTLVIAYGKDIR